MCESIVVVGAALSADVDAPTERVHSAPGARRGQSPRPLTSSRPRCVKAEPPLSPMVLKTCCACGTAVNSMRQPSWTRVATYGGWPKTGPGGRPGVKNSLKRNFRTPERQTRLTATLDRVSRDGGAPSAPSSSPSSQRTTPSRPSPTTTSVGGRSSNTGSHRTANSPATRRRERKPF